MTPAPTLWTDTPVTVLGLSKSGVAVAEYLAKRGARVLISEVLPATPTNEALRQKLETLGCTIEMGGHTKQVYTHAPLVIASPGIPPTSPVIHQLALSGVEVISEVELAWRENQTTPQARWVGITGTNGKTTTTTIIATILQAAGQVAPACGNIGTPIIQCIDTTPSPQTLVAELSSFQLAFSPKLTADIAVFLNLTPDHVDWHGSLEAYRQAKLTLFTGAQSPQWVVLNAADPVSETIVRNTTANPFWFSQNPAESMTEARKAQDHIVILKDHIYLHRVGEGARPLMPLSDLQLMGRHNWDNVMAAIATALLAGVAEETIIATCKAFRGVEHRLEPVTTIATPQGTIPVYNDSKATNTDAAISALRAFENQPVVLIAGGRDKHETLDRFAHEVHQHAKAVVLLGEAKGRFSEALQASGYNSLILADTLENALEKAVAASSGEPVLFSPACASFDMFKNFEARGTAFKEATLQLKARLEQSQVLSH